MRISDWSSYVCSSDLDGSCPGITFLQLHTGVSDEFRGYLIIIHRCRMTAVIEQDAFHFPPRVNELHHEQSFVDLCVIIRGPLYTCLLHHSSVRKSVVSGNSVSVRVALDGRRNI